MNPKRLLALLAFVFVVGFGLVHLESQKVGYARQIGRLNNQLQELDYQCWQGQLKLAKLCSPEQLRQRSEAMVLETVLPSHLINRADSSDGQALAVGLSGP